MLAQARETDLANGFRIQIERLSGDLQGQLAAQAGDLAAP